MTTSSRVGGADASTIRDAIVLVPSEPEIAAFTVVGSMPASLKSPLSTNVDPWNVNACPPRLPLSVTALQLWSLGVGFDDIGRDRFVLGRPRVTGRQAVSCIKVQALS